MSLNGKRKNIGEKRKKNTILKDDVSKKGITKKSANRGNDKKKEKKSPDDSNSNKKVDQLKSNAIKNKILLENNTKKKGPSRRIRLDNTIIRDDDNITKSEKKSSSSSMSISYLNKRKEKKTKCFELINLAQNILQKCNENTESIKYEELKRSISELNSTYLKFIEHCNLIVNENSITQLLLREVNDSIKENNDKKERKKHSESNIFETNIESFENSNDKIMHQVSTGEMKIREEMRHKLTSLKKLIIELSDDYSHINRVMEYNENITPGETNIEKKSQPHVSNELISKYNALRSNLIDIQYSNQDSLKLIIKQQNAFKKKMDRLTESIKTMESSDKLLKLMKQRMMHDEIVFTDLKKNLFVEMKNNFHPLFLGSIGYVDGKRTDSYGDNLYKSVWDSKSSKSNS